LNDAGNVVFIFCYDVIIIYHESDRLARRENRRTVSAGRRLQRRTRSISLRSSNRMMRPISVAPSGTRVRRVLRLVPMNGHPHSSRKDTGRRDGRSSKKGARGPTIPFRRDLLLRGRLLLLLLLLLHTKRRSLLPDGTYELFEALVHVDSCLGRAFQERGIEIACPQSASSAVTTR